eukprot:gnl/MRDRNA2_/MRDRNA2_57089_c0_seq1.p1 gnl/MRDRNA2_/MRDRNA2_57089_c0~~gnl/MRDRNA2_/MRDRNA2_57089_c0_seq1.p1  ORF type:complete len:367 (+),score=64.91 gnl/MRDRNA2_/MRDRNA2_57089_c0_seq1:77-1177(+)
MVRSILVVALHAYVVQTQVTPQRRFWPNVYQSKIWSRLVPLRSSFHDTLTRLNVLESQFDKDPHDPFRSLPKSRGSLVSRAASDVAQETKSTVAVYKIEDDKCSQAMIDKKFESFCGLMKFNKGTCAEQGFTLADGTAKVGVPMVGDISVSLFAKELASEAFTKVFGETLMQGKEAKSTRFALAGKGTVAIYFTAKWCRPCKHFMPQMRKAYKENLQGKGVEIVLVSLDHNQQEFDWYYEQMPWLALPYADREKELALVKEFSVSAIPRVIFYNPEGNVTTEDGKAICDLDPFGDKYPDGPWKKVTSDSSSTGLLALSFAMARSLNGVVMAIFVVVGAIFFVVRFHRSISIVRKESLLATEHLAAR